MLKHSINNAAGRIIDANINRAKEGLRVCEEIARFILESRKLTSDLKKIRHKISELTQNFPFNTELIKRRAALKDIGKDIYDNELNRKGITDILFANMQRVKESIRVLEEFSKLMDKKPAIGFKQIRYEIYELEKRITEKIPPLYDNK